MPKPKRLSFPLGLYRVHGASMEPTLQAGDLIVGLRWFTPRAGQLVIARTDRLLIKRLTSLTAEGLWLLGDNPAVSTDSRHFGPLPADRLLARVLWRLPG